MFYRLEPYILKFVAGFTPNQVMDITSTYVFQKRGSEEFMGEMLAVSAKVSKDARLTSIVTLIKSLSPKFIKRDQFFLHCSKIMPIFA